MVECDVFKLSLRHVMHIVFIAVIIRALSLANLRQHNFLCRFSDGHDKQRCKVLRKAKRFCLYDDQPYRIK